jgi:hypothetical protein
MISKHDATGYYILFTIFKYDFEIDFQGIYRFNDKCEIDGVDLD